MLNSSAMDETRLYVVIDDVLHVRLRRPSWDGKLHRAVTTSDGRPVTHGMAVFDYDWRRGFVDLSEVARRQHSDGWFLVKTRPEYVGDYAYSGSLMNDQRVRTTHWSTGEPA